MLNTNTSLEKEDILCETHTAAQAELIKIWRYWLGGVLLMFLSVLGLLTNTVSIFILTRKILAYKTFNQLLTAMAGFDSIYLLLMSYDSFGHIYIKDKDNSETLDWYYIKAVLYPYFLHPVKSISMTGSIYMMIAVAIERHIAVNKPFTRIPKNAGECRKVLSYRFFAYLLPVLFLSILLNITKFMESSFSSKYPLFIKITPLMMNPTYLLAFSSVRLVTLGFVPLTIISVLNYKIYRKVQQSSSNKKSDDCLLRVLISIVVIFIVCNIPHFIILLYEVKIMATIKNCYRVRRLIPFWNHILGFVSHNLLVLNPSLNFLVYCLVGKAFRRVATSYFPCCNEIPPIANAIHGNIKFTWSFVVPQENQNNNQHTNKELKYKQKLKLNNLHKKKNLAVVNEEDKEVVEDEVLCVQNKSDEVPVKEEDRLICPVSHDFIKTDTNIIEKKRCTVFEIPVFPGPTLVINKELNENYIHQTQLILHKHDKFSLEILI